MIKLLFAFISLLSVCTLLLVIFLCKQLKKQENKRKELEYSIQKLGLDERLKWLESQVKGIIKDTTKYLQDHQDRLEVLEKSNSSTSRINLAESRPIEAAKKENDVLEKKERGNKKEHKEVVAKTFFLGLNSEDFFPNNGVSEQKTETSKFVATLTSPTEGTFIPIDVERIRSTSISASVKQSGIVSVKDAQTFKVVNPGKIRKEDSGWVIESPVVVEYIK